MTTPTAKTTTRAHIYEFSVAINAHQSFIQQDHPVKPTQKQALIVLAAILGYGGWGVYSNLLDQPSDMLIVAWRAGVIQGCYAGLLTLINLALLELLYKRLHRRMGPTPAIFCALALATAAQYSLIIPIHLINGTPNIALTLLPGFVIGTLFSFAYLWGLHHASLSR